MLTDQLSYPEAIYTATSAHVTAPVYLIIGGVARDQGAILTRDRNKLDDFWPLESSATSTHAWYILETNYVSQCQPVPKMFL